MKRTTYLGAVEVDDGFNGARVVLHVCVDETGPWAVWQDDGSEGPSTGWYRESYDRPEIRALLEG